MRIMGKFLRRRGELLPTSVLLAGVDPREGLELLRRRQVLQRVELELGLKVIG